MKLRKMKNEIAGKSELFGNSILWSTQTKLSCHVEIMNATKSDNQKEIQLFLDYVTFVCLEESRKKSLENLSIYTVFFKILSY